MLFEVEEEAQPQPTPVALPDGVWEEPGELHLRLKQAEELLRWRMWYATEVGDVEMSRPLGEATGLPFSARNSLLVGAQAPGALMLRGRKGWGALGVEVPPGAKGAVILAPSGGGKYKPTLVYSDREVGFRVEAYPAQFLLPALSPWAREEDMEEGEDMALLRAATRFLAARLPRGFLPWEEGRRATLWLAALGAETLFRRRGVVPDLPREVWLGAFGGRPSALRDALLWAHGAVRALAQRMGLQVQAG